ncbi:hypothetical protein KQI84_04555 [bacterium]|nr:hypothetical protein [bacterium]
MPNDLGNGDPWAGFKARRDERPEGGMGTFVMVLAFMALLGATLAILGVFFIFDWDLTWGTDVSETLTFEHILVIFGCAAGVGAAVGVGAGLGLWKAGKKE